MLADETIQESPLKWAETEVKIYNKYKANKIVAEKNDGGEMVEKILLKRPDLNS